MNQHAASLWAGLLELLAPAHCPGCDLPVGGWPGGFCGACEPLLELAQGLGGGVYLYGGPLADAIVGLKYAQQSERAKPLGRLLADAAVAHASLVDLVMPVPLHPARLRARGYNQACLLAVPVARRLGLPLDTTSLRRVRDTPPQAGLARDGRLDNVRGGFMASRARGGRPGRVLLVDDVRTTGATLASAADALLKAGHPLVRTLALARAQA